MTSSTRQTVAAEWVLRLRFEGKAAEGSFEKWLDQDEKNAFDYSEAQATAERISKCLREHPLARRRSNRDLSASLIAERLAHPRPERSALHGFWRRFAASPMAARLAHATLLLSLALGVLALLVQSSLVATTYSTGWKQEGTVMLRDGSTMKLAPATLVHVPFWITRRTVWLVRGEAYFDVAHEQHRRFVVKAGHTAVYSHGTAFSVRVEQGGDTSVRVAEGAVSIGTINGERVSAGQIAYIKNGEVRVESPVGRSDDLPVGIAKFIYVQDARLDTIVSQFNQEGDKKLVIADPRIASVRVSGGFRTEGAERFADSLHRVAGIRYVVTKNEVRLFGPVWPAERLD